MIPEDYEIIITKRTRSEQLRYLVDMLSKPEKVASVQIALIVMADEMEREATIEAQET